PPGRHVDGHGLGARRPARRRRPSVIRVLVVDDQALVRAGAVAVVDAAADLTVVGEAADGAQALTVQRERRADVVVLDVRMPVMDGIETTARPLDPAMPPRRVLAPATLDLHQCVYAALRAGAPGLRHTAAPPHDLPPAVR